MTEKQAEYKTKEETELTVPLDSKNNTTEETQVQTLNIVLLKNFVDQQEELAELQVKLTAKKIEFQKKNEILFSAIEQKQQEVESAKFILTEAARREFITTGNKKLLGGIGIRVQTRLEYFYNNALGWAKEHNLCLALDTKEFEKIAKTQDLDFVEKEEVVKVTFPKEVILEGEKECLKP